MVIGLLVSSFRVGAAFGFSVSVLGSSCSRGFVFVFGAVGSIFLLVSFRLCALLQLLSVISVCWLVVFASVRFCFCAVGSIFCWCSVSYVSCYDCCR